jgi:predicted double-glycine peptidase
MTSSRLVLLCTLITIFLLAAGCVSSPGLGIPGISSGPKILTGVPDVRQSTPVTCGPASLQAVLNYWGTDQREEDLAMLLGTTPEGETLPESIVEVARQFNYSAEMRDNLTLADLEASIDAGIPVIVTAQAYAGNESPPYTQDWEDGHYMVVIGVDSENVYLEDPAILGSRGMIPRLEFLTRWHDQTGLSPDDPSAQQYQHLGIFINDTTPASYPPFVHVD